MTNHRPGATPSHAPRAPMAQAVRLRERFLERGYDVLIISPDDIRIRPSKSPGRTLYRSYTLTEALELLKTA